MKEPAVRAPADHPDDKTIVRPASGTTPAGDENIVDLIGHLTSQSAHLAQQQISLVQAEMREAVTDLKEAMGAMLGAAVLGISGLGVTLMGIAYLLGDAIDNLGLATLLVGIIVLIIAGILYASGKKKVEHSSIKPERSIDTAERTPDAATGNLTNSGVSR